MSDEELREFGKAARYMVSPGANVGKPPLPTFVLQLEEARADISMADCHSLIHSILIRPPVGYFLEVGGQCVPT